ncbi:FixH family protein [Halalkalibacterium ligniniphilum]|uniref:FixH family protein n=1 Tax=Halalkalibacterium ligniniphilum TaxID=1134413 RepID=UPI0003495AE2|nr:FixH family protein [Halalkalibacterium ligniniphilum]
MKKKWFMTFVASFIVMTACGPNEEGQEGNEIVDELTPIEVELSVPEKAEVGETVTFSSTVTQGDDLVDDANEVVYEIWLEGQKEQSEMIEADTQEENVYLLNYLFEKAGLYHVQTHVTARGLHRMPTANIQVGEAEENKEAHHETTHEHEHEHMNGVELDTKVENDRIVVQIAVEGSAFTGGKVTLEMWQQGDEQHQWLDFTEVGNGEYELRNIETFSGLYSAVVHIVDEEVHEHVDIELEF